jgi:hypothetical protein
MFEIWSSPVSAVIVTQAVMSVPAFVMKIFDPLTVAQLRARARCAGVRAGAGLSQAECGQLLSSRELRQPLALLRVGAVVVDRQRAQRVIRGDRDRDRRVDASELFDRDCVRHRVRPGAAVFLRDRHAHQPELTELGHELVGEASLAVDLLGDGRDALLRELAHGGADELVLLVEIEVQVARRCASSTIRRTP